MSAKDNGGPAFPQNDAVVNRINNEAGMTLRDYFAGHALVACIRIAPHAATELQNPTSIARAAYQFADFMLAERAK